MDEQVAKWISELAIEIHKVITRYNAKPRFGEMIKQYVETRKNEFDKNRKWSERRIKHFVQSDPRIHNKQLSPPQEGWQWETFAIHTFEQTSSGEKRISKLISAWVPPELSSNEEPKIVHLLPLNREHELSLCEKYTLLAAIYDCARKGTDSISPWQLSDKIKPQPTSISYAYERISFELLCDSVTRLSLDNKNWLEAILHDVETDLKSLKPQKISNRRLRGKWTTPTVIVGIVTILVMIAIAWVQCRKPPTLPPQTIFKGEQITIGPNSPSQIHIGNGETTQQISIDNRTQTTNVVNGISDEGLKQIRDGMLAVQKQQDAELRAKFNLGYILFTATERKEIVPLDSPMNDILKVDWKPGYNVSFSDKTITIRLPDIRFSPPNSGELNITGGWNLIVRRHSKSSLPSLAVIGNYEVALEIVSIDEDSIIFAIGLRSPPKI